MRFTSEGDRVAKSHNLGPWIKGARTFSTKLELLVRPQDIFLIILESIDNIADNLMPQSKLFKLLKLW